MSKRLRVALIGAGRIGAGHARRLASVSSCQLVAVVDHDQERARRVAAPLGARVETDYREVLADPDIDAVAIVTQVPSHAELAEAAALAGKPFFLEKPLAHDLEAGWRVVEVAEQTGTPAMIGFHRRYDPPYVEAMRRLAAGEMGHLEGYRAVARDPYPPALDYLVTSGDLLVDMGIHDLDCARFLVGEVAEVHAIGSALAVPELVPHGLFDTAVATLKFESGAVGTLEVALRTAYGYEIRTEVLGEKGRLHIEIDRQPDLTVYDERGGGFGRPRNFEERFGVAYRLELEAFVENVLAGAPLEPGPRDAWRSLRLAFAAQHSLKTGTTVRVEEFEPLPVGGMAGRPAGTDGERGRTSSIDTRIGPAYPAPVQIIQLCHRFRESGTSSPLEVSMKRITVVLTLALFLLLGSSSLAQTVNVLCSPDLAWCEALGPAYEAATGNQLDFVRLSSSEALARIRAEAANPVFDVWFGGTGDPHLVAFHEGLTEFYKPSAWDQLLPSLKRAVGETYIPLYTGAIGFTVNEGILEEEGIEVPRCWADLTDPSFKNLLAMPDPNSSGTAYTIIATVVQIMGEEEGFEYLAALHQNMQQYTRSGSAPGQLAGRGDVAVAIQFMHDGVKFAQEGFPVTTIAPCEGTGYEIGGLSLVANAPNREAAIEFIEWALTPEAQSIAAEQGNSFQIQSNQNTPVHPASPQLAEINLIDYDFEKYGSPEVRDGLVQRWTNEIFPVPR